jgi:hypothetical protein
MVQSVTERVDVTWHKAGPRKLDTDSKVEEISNACSDIEQLGVCTDKKDGVWRQVVRVDK